MEKWLWINTESTCQIMQTKEIKSEALVGTMEYFEEIGERK